MDIVLGYRSSLAYWRTSRSRFVARPERVDVPRFFAPGEHRPPEGCVRIARQLGVDGGSAPLDLLVPSAAARVRSREVRCSVLDRRTARRAFVRLGEGLYVASPELCFLLCARHEGVLRAVELGFELCGTYRVARSREQSALYDQPPLTTPARLRVFVRRSPGADGVRAARPALPHVLEGAASPKETQLAMLLHLPRCWGGYGLPSPRLNHAVRIPPAARGRGRGWGAGAQLRCDLYWPAARLAAEYDSAAYHSELEKQERDSARRTALAAAGVVAVSVSRRQLHERPETDELARAIARHLHVRISPRTAAWEEKQVQLRTALLRDAL